MGDHKGGAGRNVGQAPRRAPYGGVPGITADNALALRHADRLNDARNPGRQRVLRTQTLATGENAATAAKDYVDGYRLGFVNPATRRALRTPAARTGFEAGRFDRGNRLWQERLQNSPINLETINSRMTRSGFNR